MLEAWGRHRIAAALRVDHFMAHTKPKSRKPSVITPCFKIPECQIRLVSKRGEKDG